MRESCKIVNYLTEPKKNKKPQVKLNAAKNKTLPSANDSIK